MKNKFKYLVFCLFIFLSIFGFTIKSKAEENKIKLHFFHSNTCSICAKEKLFLNSIMDKYSNLEIIDYEIDSNAENKELMNFVKEKYENTRNGVPFTVIGSYSFVGYSDSIASQIEHFIKNYQNDKDPNKMDRVVEQYNNPDLIEITGTKDDKEEEIKNENITIYLFHSKTCPHCKSEKKFLNNMIDKYKNIVVKYYEVSNKENKKLMQILKEKYDNDRSGVPFTIIGDNSFVGYSENTAYQIEEVIKELEETGDPNSAEKIINDPSIDIDLSKVKVDENIKVIPFLGKIDARKVSLPLISIIIGFVDGFNPCAMWVLIFLISILIGMENKKRAMSLGIIFLVASASVYLFFMLVWITAQKHFNGEILQKIIGVVAILGALLNLKSFFKKSEDGCSVADANKKKKIFEKIRKFTSEKSFILATIGIITLAISVNIIELACSAALPTTYTEILSINNLSSFEYGFYIFLYILFFMIDDIIIFIIAMATMQVKGISNKYTKYSHLIGGIIMLIIGVLLIIDSSILKFNI